MSGCGAFTLVSPGSGVTTVVLGFSADVSGGQSDGDAVTTFIRILETVASLSEISTNLNRQSAALL